MIYLVYIFDHRLPEFEPFLAGVADSPQGIEKLKIAALKRFSWISDPEFTIKETKLNEVA